MNLRMGGQVFVNVGIPLLWGDRAVLQDERRGLSIVDLSGEKAFVEVVADEPAPGVEFLLRLDGVVILRDGIELYTYNQRDKSITSKSLGLPDVEIGDQTIRIGGLSLTGNLVSGSGVGVAVSKSGIAIGAPLPPGLASLAA